ncbi:hypothetical protein HZB03_01460 [Candidatus Woesearchaeota archaeon]|nr:hypothetical protein [Candidatus Woesearchaeota archaeon]
MEKRSLKKEFQEAQGKQQGRIGPMLVLRPFSEKHRDKYSRSNSLSKKGFITDVVVDFYAYIVFVLVIIIFAVIFKLGADAKKQRLQDVQGVNDGNFMMQVLLRQQIDAGSQKLTYADLLVLYDNNQSKALALKEKQSAATAKALPYAAAVTAAAAPLALPIVAPAMIGSSILFGEENVYYKNIDTLTTDFLKINVDTNPRYEDKCYYLIIRGTSFMYSKVSDRCSGDYGRDELFEHLKEASIPFGKQGAAGAGVVSGVGTVAGTLSGATLGAAAYGLVLGPGALVGGAVLGYALSGFEINLCKIPQSSYLTYLPNLDPRADNIVVLFMLDVPRLAKIFPGDGKPCEQLAQQAPSPQQPQQQKGIVA